MTLLRMSADVYENIKPGEVRWIELARGERDVFVMRVEGVNSVYDTDGYRIGCACSEALVWVDLYFDSYTDEEKEKLFRYAVEQYERDLKEMCEGEK